MTAVLTDEKIPNNVNLGGDKRLQRALEAWQPQFIDWWKQMGPVGWQERDIYLRTAVSVETDGWANFDYVRMPDYRWGIFLEPKQEGRTHGFGDNHGWRAAFVRGPGGPGADGRASPLRWRQRRGPHGDRLLRARAGVVTGACIEHPDRAGALGWPGAAPVVASPHDAGNPDPSGALGVQPGGRN